MKNFLFSLKKEYIKVNDTSFGGSQLYYASETSKRETKKKLGNIAKNNLAWSIQLEHAVLEYEGHALLFIRIPEQQNKPEQQK